MHRVRLASGEEAAFRTPQELATAIRSGVVQSSAHVFHTATNSWVSIQAHPEYVKVHGGALPAPARVAPPKPKAETPHEPGDNGLIDLPLGPASASAAPAAPAEDSVAPNKAAKPEPPSPIKPSGKSRNRGPVKSRKAVVRHLLGVALPIILAAAIGGGVTITGALQLLELGAEEPEPPPAGAFTRRAKAERARAAELTRSLSDAIASSAPTVTADSASQDSLEAGATYLTRQGARQPRVLTYVDAYADAQITLEEAFELVAFRELFSPVRFSSTDSIRAARRMVAAARNIVSAYRGQEVKLEQSYNPGGGDVRGSLRESYDRAETARALLSSADSLFGLLLAQDGRFVIRQGQIRFSASAPALRYGELRQKIVSLTRAGAPVAREDEAVGALGRLRRVIGTDDPPIPVH